MGADHLSIFVIRSSSSETRYQGPQREDLSQVTLLDSYLFSMAHRPYEQYLPKVHLAGIDLPRRFQFFTPTCLMMPGHTTTVPKHSNRLFFVDL